MIYNLIIKERIKLISQIEVLKKNLSELPKENLLCTKNGKNTKWYISNGMTPIYIPKSKRSLAEALAIKKYYTMQLNELMMEVNSLDKYLASHKDSNIKASCLFDETSNYKELLKSHFQAIPKDQQDWQNATFDHNTSHPKALIHTTFAGHKVRSKSEVIIANSLFINKIPYRYECGVHFDNIMMYPDFTICHPENMKIYYWEHFGMMDSISYRETTFNKLRIYSNNGIVPSINLIATFETQRHPIDSGKIQSIIQEYFL